MIWTRRNIWARSLTGRRSLRSRLWIIITSSVPWSRARPTEARQEHRSSKAAQNKIWSIACSTINNKNLKRHLSNNTNSSSSNPRPARPTPSTWPSTSPAATDRRQTRWSTPTERMIRVSDTFRHSLRNRSKWNRRLWRGRMSQTTSEQSKLPKEMLKMKSWHLRRTSLILVRPKWRYRRFSSSSNFLDKGRTPTDHLRNSKTKFGSPSARANKYWCQKPSK